MKCVVKPEKVRFQFHSEGTHTAHKTITLRPRRDPALQSEDGQMVAPMQNVEFLGPKPGKAPRNLERWWSRGSRWSIMAPRVADGEGVRRSAEY
jgi:hypothetical protein